MYYLHKVIRLNYVLSKNSYNKLRTFNCLKIHTSIQKLTDTSSQKNSILVYEAPLKTRVKIVKLLSLSSSMIGFAVFPRVIYDMYTANVLIACGVGAVSIFFLSTPFMLHWITKRYVLDLHYENKTKTFTATTFNILCQTKEIKFQADDVKVPDLPGMFNSFIVNGKPLFVDANMVQDPDAYSHMMGYDKPFEFVLKPDGLKENKTS